MLAVSKEYVQKTQARQGQYSNKKDHSNTMIETCFSQN